MQISTPQTKQEDQGVLIIEQSQKNVMNVRNEYQYEQLFQGMEIKSAFIFSFINKSYILITNRRSDKFSIYDIELNIKIECQLNEIYELKSLLTSQKNLFLQNWKYLYLLCLIDNKFIVKKRYLYKETTFAICMLLINHQQDLILEQYQDGIRLRTLKPSKQIIKVQQKKQLEKQFDQNRNILMFIEITNDGEEFINIFNLLNRQIIIRQLQQNIIQIVLVKNTDDLLVQIESYGLFLFRINYSDNRIHKIKLLNYNVEQLCVFDDENNLLHLITHHLIIRFDKQYNILQRFKMNYNFDSDYCFYQLLPSMKNVRVIQNLPEIFSFEENFLYQVYQLKKKNQNSEKELCISQNQNYQMGYVYETGRKQHLLSSNQRFLACIINQQLMLYEIQNNQDRYIYFNTNILFLNFSSNSNYIYVVLDDMIYCYKTPNNLKKCYELHDSVCQILSNPVGFVISINQDEGFVKAYSKSNRKLIFKLSTVEYHSLDYQAQNGIILVSNEEEGKLYTLCDRKLITNLKIENKQCKLIQNTNNFLILTYEEQLQLWSYKDKYPVFQRDILDQVRIILQGYQGFYCIKTFNEILILDQNFQISDSINYLSQKRTKIFLFDSDIISEDDKIIQQDFYIKLSKYQWRNNHNCFKKVFMESITVSLEQREQK